MNSKAMVLSRVRTKLENACLDLRFGRLLRGVKTSPYAQLGAYATANSNYGDVQRLLEGRVKPSDVMVDVGCGKGRVINAWLLAGYANRMIGVELDAAVAADTRARLRRYPNVCITTGDIVANFPDDGTIFYLYNPFDGLAMTKFKARLKKSLEQRACREATIIYNNCLHMDTFLEDPECEIEWGKLQHPVAIVRFPDQHQQGAPA
ncbi:MAG TPA: hypothetical protein VJN93_01375 [Candidatus Acidoferrum sp.]|nr:hypothetical protein [Candidatus Acidoferrum sp.]